MKKNLKAILSVSLLFSTSGLYSSEEFIGPVAEVVVPAVNDVIEEVAEVVVPAVNDVIEEVAKVIPAEEVTSIVEAGKDELLLTISHFGNKTPKILEYINNFSTFVKTNSEKVISEIKSIDEKSWIMIGGFAIIAYVLYKNDKLGLPSTDTKKRK